MRPFSLSRGTDAAGAVRAASGGKSAFLAGGTTLVDLMKLDVMRPEVLVDINPLQARLGGIEATPQGLRLGALARMADVADHPDVRRDYPVVAESLQLAASGQLRNMASMGGNLLQRTRCSYFRDTSYEACNKRNPGSGCAALGGVNRIHAVLGTTDRCISAYPGDFAQAMVALDGHVETLGPAGARAVPLVRLHLQRADTPHVETTLLSPGVRPM
jgi:xanthine dehydrogenase YagS FAD-binding subunit